MSKLDDYAQKYKTIRMERRQVIWQMTLHTDGGSLRWSFLPHGEPPEAFYDVGCGIGSCGVPRPSVADSVRGPAPGAGQPLLEGARVGYPLYTCRCRRIAPTSPM